MFDFIPVYLYSTVFYWIVFLVSTAVAMSYISSADNTKLLRQNDSTAMLLAGSLLILYIGYRPVSWIFQDMMSYAHNYDIVQSSLSSIDFKAEWGLSVLMSVCKLFGLSVKAFFLIVALGYVGMQLLSCRKLLWENTWLAMLFIISAFSFWGFGTNGIRNGLGCGFAMYGIACLAKKQYISTAMLFTLAYGTHHSTILPIVLSVVAVTLVKSPKQAVYFWMASIIISLVAGNTVSNFFAGWGFDDRVSTYLTRSSEVGLFSHYGFRWDFLIYSAVPVWLTWYITQNKGINDETFNTLAITYILCNSFWVMVIRSAFCNRFAYLSWFLYPLVIAYAFIRLPIWSNQDNKAGWALFAHAAFSMFMFLIGKLY